MVRMFCTTSGELNSPCYNASRYKAAGIATQSFNFRQTAALLLSHAAFTPRHSVFVNPSRRATLLFEQHTSADTPLNDTLGSPPPHERRERTRMRAPSWREAARGRPHAPPTRSKWCRWRQQRARDEEAQRPPRKPKGAVDARRRPRGHSASNAAKK